jgi:hypothetical protein
VSLCEYYNTIIIVVSFYLADVVSMMESIIASGWRRLAHIAPRPGGGAAHDDGGVGIMKCNRKKVVRAAP